MQCTQRNILEYSYGIVNDATEEILTNNTLKGNCTFEAIRNTANRMVEKSGRQTVIILEKIDLAENEAKDD